MLQTFFSALSVNENRFLIETFAIATFLPMLPTFANANAIYFMNNFSAKHKKKLSKEFSIVCKVVVEGKEESTVRHKSEFLCLFFLASSRVAYTMNGVES